MKKILILTLSLILLFSFVACSGGNNGTASDENAGNENTELTLIGSWIHKKSRCGALQDDACHQQGLNCKIGII